MNKFDEQENEEFCEEEYFNFEDLIFSVKKKHFGKIFAQDDVSLAELNKDFRKIFLKVLVSKF